MTLRHKLLGIPGNEDEFFGVLDSGKIKEVNIRVRGRYSVDYYGSPYAVKISAGSGLGRVLLKKYTGLIQSCEDGAAGFNGDVVRAYELAIKKAERLEEHAPQLTVTINGKTKGEIVRHLSEGSQGFSILGKLAA